MIERDIVRILEVVDTREYEEGPDGKVRPVPGSGHVRDCDRCGRQHEVHALVELRDGSRATVGTSCATRGSLIAKRLAAGARDAKKIAAIRPQIAKLGLELDEYRKARAQVELLAPPPITSKRLDQYRMELRIGDAWIWSFDPVPGKDDYAHVLERWREHRLTDLGFSSGRFDSKRTTLRWLNEDLQRAEARMAKAQQFYLGSEEPRPERSSLRRILLDMKTTTKTARHLDPATIIADNAKRLAEAERQPDYLGPQMTAHRKPNAGGGPCDVCGCNGIRLGVLHKAKPCRGGRGAFIVYAMDYSHDWSERCLDWDGRRV